MFTYRALFASCLVFSLQPQKWISTWTAGDFKDCLVTELVLRIPFVLKFQTRNAQTTTAYPIRVFQRTGVSQGLQGYLWKNLSVVFISLKHTVGSSYIFGCTISGPTFLNTIICRGQRMAAVCCKKGFLVIWTDRKWERNHSIASGILKSKVPVSEHRVLLSIKVKHKLSGLLTVYDQPAEVGRKWNFLFGFQLQQIK